ncbi:MAG: hypothetical protein GY715_21975 [Planctomycetes bacterium]|nr:hypothetical protein [Planctomycetota bacterium]
MKHMNKKKKDHQWCRTAEADEVAEEDSWSHTKRLEGRSPEGETPAWGCRPLWVQQQKKKQYLKRKKTKVDGQQDWKVKA